MNEDVLSVQSEAGRTRAGRRLLRGLALGLLVLVGMSLAWVFAGVTQWGPYTLVGPGYGGIVQTRDGRVRVRPGWKRFAEADGRARTISFQFSDKTSRFMVITPEPAASGRGSTLRLMRLHYHFGWIVAFSLPPASWTEPGQPLRGIARVP